MLLRLAVGLIVAGGVPLLLLVVRAGVPWSAAASGSALAAPAPPDELTGSLPSALHVLSDLLIALSYFSISATLLFLVGRAGRQIPFSWMLVAFGVFIVACGAGHLTHVLALATPAGYWALVGVQAVTVLASVTTALLLPPLVPRVLFLLGEALAAGERKSALEDANAQLERRVAERTHALSETVQALQHANAQLAALAAERERSEARFRAMIEKSSEAVALVSADGVARYCSPAGPRLLGYPSGVSESGGVFETIHPDDAGRGRILFTELASDPGGTRVAQVRVRHQDGAYRWIEAAGTNHLHDEAVGAIIVNFRDVTGRVAAEAQLTEANARLHQTLEELHASQRQLVQQERLRALGEMASGIAHDLNNALAPVLGFSEMLLTDQGGLSDREKARHYLEMIHAGAEDAAAVVGRLREFYRQRADDETLDEVDLNALVEQVIELTEPKWKDQAQARGKTLDVRAELGPVPPVLGHRSELREALINLVFNAVDATERGGITLRTRHDEDRVLLEVTDTGTGMSQEVRQRCLDPFFSTKGEGGTGLGLSMVYGIVQRHEGTLEIESEMGRGTSFRIGLRPASTPSTASSGANERDDDTPMPPLVPRLRTLVVDDEPAVAEVTATFLRAEGHAVEQVGSGEEALRRLAAERFDVLLTDWGMPGINGAELSRAAGQIAPTTRIVVVTGYADHIAACLDAPDGVDAVLGKPLTFAKLREALAPHR